MIKIVQIIVIGICLSWSLGCSSDSNITDTDAGNDTDTNTNLDTNINNGRDTSIPEERKTIFDHTTTDLSLIPDSAIAQAVQKLHIAYQHTSHGSQLVSGMWALEEYPAYNGKYRVGSGGLDLADEAIPSVSDLSTGDYEDDNGDTPWVVATREYLDSGAGANTNVVLWSWCSINGHDAQRYVYNLEKLIAEYPNVIFPFMTGHAESEGEDVWPGSVHYNNELIRKHAKQNNRVLFDFADIEAYDPDGNYYWDRGMDDALNYNDGGNWAVEWIAANPNAELSMLTVGNGNGYNGVTYCAHSDYPYEAGLNCVLKGRAAWWMWAMLAGWDGSQE